MNPESVNPDQQGDSDVSVPVLYGYWRSSSSYRVRIALNLKGISYTSRAVHLVREGGEQHGAEYRRINPLGLVPALVHAGRTVTQSLAIMEYLEEAFPGAPLLLPLLTPLLTRGAAQRARVRSIAQTIACEIQPMNNLGIMNYLRDPLGAADEQVNAWYRTWVARGFEALEKILSGSAETGTYCHGEQAGLADCCLVPQVYNAERFNCDLAPFPEICRITAACRALPEFIAAAPENQPDAVV